MNEETYEGVTRWLYTTFMVFLFVFGLVVLLCAAAMLWRFAGMPSVSTIFYPPAALASGSTPGSSAPSPTASNLLARAQQAYDDCRKVMNDAEKAGYTLRFNSEWFSRGGGCETDATAELTKTETLQAE